MKSDLNIAQESELKPIEEIAALVGVSKDALINYGPYIAKIDASKIIINDVMPDLADIFDHHFEDIQVKRIKNSPK